jgi:hypothetical protein
MGLGYMAAETQPVRLARYYGKKTPTQNLLILYLKSNTQL